MMPLSHQLKFLHVVRFISELSIRFHWSACPICVLLQPVLIIGILSCFKSWEAAAARYPLHSALDRFIRQGSTSLPAPARQNAAGLAESTGTGPQARISGSGQASRINPWLLSAHGSLRVLINPWETWALLSWSHVECPAGLWKEAEIEGLP